ARPFVEMAQQDGEAVVALEALGADGERIARARVARRAQEDHREVAAKDRHARVLEVRVAGEDERGELGDEPGPVAADRREDEPAPHARRVPGARAHREGRVAAEALVDVREAAAPERAAARAALQLRVAARAAQAGVGRGGAGAQRALSAERGVTPERRSP